MFKRIINSQNLRVSTIGSLISKFGTAFFAFLSGVLLAKLMSVDEYGVYVFVLSITTMLSIPTSLGLPMMISRNVSKYKVNNDLSKIRGLIIRTNQIVLSLFLIVILISSVLYFLWWNKYDDELVKTIWVSFLVLLFLSFSSLRNGLLNGSKFIVLGELSGTFLRYGLICFLATIALISNYKVTPFIAMVFNVIATLISFALSHYFSYRKVLKPTRHVNAEFETNYWIKETIPFSLNAGINISRERILTFLLATFSSMSAVAIFDIALRGAALVSFTLDAINKGIAPYISSAYELNDKKQLQNIVTKASRIVFFFSFPVAILFIIKGDWVIELLFGLGYKNAYKPLIIICIGQIFNALTGSVGLLLMMTGNQGFLAKVNIILTIVGAVLSVPLIYYFNEIGAASIVACTIVIQNLIFYSFVIKKLGVNTLIINFKKTSV